MADKLSGIDTTSTMPAVDAGRALQRVPDATTQSHTEQDSSPTDVHITNTAAQLAALEKVVSAMPSVDDARVGAIRTAIEQGRYEVSSTRVAAGLLRIEHALAPLGIV